MCDLHSKFEEDWTKTAVAIVDDTYFGQTDTHSSDFIYLSNIMHCIGQTIIKTGQLGKCEKSDSP